MSNLNEIPSEFQVFSTEPVLRIRYLYSKWLRILLLLFLSPFLLLFTGHCLTLFLGLHEILNFRFWQAIQVLSYNGDNVWSVLLFFFTFFLLGTAACLWLWLLLGITELHATRESLTIIHRWRLLGISHKTSVLGSHIRYFNQFLDKSSEGDSWALEVVTNQRLFDKDVSIPPWMLPAKWVTADLVTRMNYKTVNLYSQNTPSSSYWLGRVLAEFYRVEFRSAAQE